jgi:hypothetical protein
MKKVANNTLVHKDLELGHKLLTTFEYSSVIIGKTKPRKPYHLQT